MAVRFPPTWTNRNGDIDGLVFKAWLEALSQYGVNGIAYATTCVKNSGKPHPPNLNEFEGYLLKRKEETPDHNLSETEQRFGGKLKPTPNGLPKLWTMPDSDHTWEQLFHEQYPDSPEIVEEKMGVLRQEVLDMGYKQCL